MSLSLVQSRAFVGLGAAKVTLEVHLDNGLLSFTLVGLADVEEARKRCAAPFKTTGLFSPTTSASYVVKLFLKNLN